MAARKKTASRKAAARSTGRARGTARPAARKKTAAPRRPAARKPAPRASAPRRKARQQPESLRLREAGCSFTADDLQQSITFYVDALGFTPGQRFERDGQLLGIELRAGSVTHWLSQDDWAKGRERKKGEGFRLYLTTVQDVDELAARVKGKGVTLDAEPQDTPYGTREFAVTDPSGFKITIGMEK